MKATWNASGYGTTTATSNVNFNVLGTYRHSQYNTPAESNCVASKTIAFIVTGNCNFSQTTLKSDFQSQTNLNGTGMTDSQNAGVLLHTGTGCSNFPPGANSSNSFTQVSSVTGSCGTTLAGDSVAVFPNPNPPGPNTACGDTHQLVTTSDTNLTQKSSQDYCPSCNTDFRGTAGHIDDYSTANNCFIGDYGNYLIIRLRAQ